MQPRHTIKQEFKAVKVFDRIISVYMDKYAMINILQYERVHNTKLENYDPLAPEKELIKLAKKYKVYPLADELLEKHCKSNSILENEIKSGFAASEFALRAYIGGVVWGFAPEKYSQMDKYLTEKSPEFQDAKRYHGHLENFKRLDRFYERQLIWVLGNLDILMQ